MPAAGLADLRVERPLARLLALDLGAEGGQLHHDLVHRAVERALAVFEVEEHAHARVGDALERPARLDRLAAEPGLLGHDEHLERRPRLERVQKPGQARARAAEDGAGDPVVAVDVLVGDGPALLRGVGAGVLDLAGDRLRLIGDAVLLGALAGVDGG